MRDLVYATAHDVATLEPTQASGFGDHTAALALFGSLTFNFDGRTGAIGYYPWLAEAIEPLDRLTWRIRVRAGLRFHNGEALDAQAVKYSFDRIRHPDFPSKRYLKTAPIERVEVLDERTVDLHTTEPIAILPARLLRADGSIVAPGHYADAPPWPKVEARRFDPVGAGPFRFVEHRPGERLVLAVHQDFRDPRGYPRPNFDRLILRVIPEPSALLEALARGEVDIAPVAADLVDQAAAVPGVRMISGPDTTRISFEINQAAHPALADRRVRQAIDHAIDVEALRRALTGGKGERLATLVNPPNAHPDIEPRPYDPEKARALLAEAGWSDGFSIDIDWSTSKDRGRVAEAMVPYLDALGIRVGSVRELDWSTAYLPAQVAGTLAGLHGHGHAGVEMTVETDLWPLHPRREANSTNWRGPQAERFVELYNELQATVDPARQAALGRALQALLHEEALSVVFWRAPRYAAVSERVAHYIPYPGAHNEDFWTIRLGEPREQGS